MSRNPAGGPSGNMEWGRKHRKEEDDLRGLNNRARREAISEQVQDFIERWDARAGEKVPCPYCKGRGHDDRGTECGFCDEGVHTLGT